MKTLICAKPGILEYRDEPSPQLTKDHAIIRIKQIGICGTDLHAFDGTQPYFSYPRILGHELSGELIDVDNATDFRAGETVTIIPYFYCGLCIACRNNKSNCCTNIQVCGVHVDGGMREYLSVPSYSLVHNNQLHGESLALIEPLAVGAHSIQRAQVKKDEFILVVGAGPIGLGVMEFARLAGGNVIALDISDVRLRFCRDKLKIQHTLNASSQDVLMQLKEITSGDMPTVVIDATGNLNAINEGLKYLAHGGRYVLVGLQKEMFSFSHPEFHKRETTLMSSRNATREDFDLVIKSIQEGAVNPSNYITHRTSFEKARDEFPQWLNPASGVIKAMITMDN